MTDASAPWVTATTAAGAYRTEIQAGGHSVVADEPVGAEGTDDGPSPYELLLGAVASCTAMTVRMYAMRKQWPLANVVVRVRNERPHAADCADCATKPVGIKRIEREIELHGDLTDEQRTRLLEIADRCPVKQTLERGIPIVPKGS